MPISSDSIEQLDDWLSHDIQTDIKEFQDRATSWLWTDNNARSNMRIGGVTPTQKKKTNQEHEFCARTPLKIGVLPYRMFLLSKHSDM